MSKKPHFKSISTNFSQKMKIFCFVIKFWNFGIFLSKILVIALMSLTLMESTIQNLQLLFVYQFQNILPKSTLRFLMQKFPKIIY